MREGPWRASEPPEEQLTKLTALVSRYGQIAPVYVREAEPVGDTRYEIVDGAAVWEALKRANAPLTQCVVLNCNQDEARLIWLSLNLTKCDLNHVKVSRAIKSLVEKFGVETVSMHCFFTPVQVDSYARLVDFDWDSFLKGDDEGPEQTGMFTPEETPGTA